MSNRTVIITGVSSGIGYALAQSFLTLGDRVLGIGLNDPKFLGDFNFIKCDLTQRDAVGQLELPYLSGEVLLINNAGRIGPIGRMSANEELEHNETFQLNTFAPLELTLKVYQSMEDKDRFTLINISSGAANNPIPSWAMYCSSKAALNMWSSCFLKEERELGRRLKVYCVAPGVVDTKMQEQIRNASPEDFSSHDRFVQLKSNDQLLGAKEVASRLIWLIEQPYSDEIYYDLRKLEL